MAQQETTFRIKAAIEGVEGVGRLKDAVKRLNNTARPAAQDIGKLTKATRILATASNRTENELRDSINIFRELRANVDMTSKEYRELTRDINRAEAALAKSGKSGKGASTRLGNFTQGVGQRVGLAAGSALVSPEAAVGGLVGGLPGVGVGLAVGQVRKAAGSVAEYAAELNLAKITLASASKNQEEYNHSLKVARQVSQDYTVDLLDTLDGYAKISAAASANNLTLEQTESVFRGVVAAGVAYGGSQADLQAIIRATTQVLSKGKVTAEEMQGQIGERLPGAVAKFAAATGRTLPQLAKDFEQGRVTIADFVKFTEKNVQDYDEIARLIGESPEKAGARLKLALDTAKENYGTFFKSAGAGIQDFLTRQVSVLNKNQDDIKKFVTNVLNASDKLFRSIKVIVEGTIGVIAPAVSFIFDNFIVKPVNTLLSVIKKIKEIASQLKRAFGDMFNLIEQNTGVRLFDPDMFKFQQSDTIDNLFKPFKDTKEELDKIFADDKYDVNDLFKPMEIDPNIFKGKDTIDDINDGLDTAKDKLSEFVEGAKQGFAKYKEGLEDVAGAMSKTVGNAFKKLEDTLVNFVQTGKFAFKDLARSIIADLTRIAVRQAIMKPLSGFLGNLNFSKNAKGNVYAANGIQKFARGGIVDKPTVFPFKNGIGLMGEAGAEAILPLKRGKGGRLGVEGGGGGSTVVNVSVDASGSSVQGDEEQSKQFGQALAAAIQAQIIDQKRPGGLLSS
tara:strand:+ start:7462 stop:9660 length:2199 start_codon:yes stop_codon:yes gene_type:complete